VANLLHSMCLFHWSLVVRCGGRDAERMIDRDIGQGIDGVGLSCIVDCSYDDLVQRRQGLFHRWMGQPSSSFGIASCNSRYCYPSIADVCLTLVLV